MLIFLSAICAYVAFHKQQGKLTIAVGVATEIQKKSLLMPIFFIIFFLLLSLRNYSIGADVLNYKSHFEAISSLTFRQVLNRSGDVLYNLLNWFISRFTEDFRIFLTIVSAIILLPIAAFYSEEREYSFMKMIIFINMPNFIMIFSGLRQAIAFSISIIAYKFVREKKILWFLVFALIAFGFHHSAFIVFVYYPLYHFTFKRKHLWFVIPAMILVYIYNRPIFTIATEILNSLFGEDYSAIADDTGAYTMLVLFILFAILAYVLPDESLMDEETLGLRNFLLMAVVIQCFVPLYALAMRMNYYFILFIPVLLSKIIKSCKSSFEQVGMLSHWVLSSYLLIYYLDKLYTSCSTGISSLGTYPYRFFWQ